MDLSLHSFILVVGLVVMAFILWDGIKKVKQSRANKLRIKLDDQLEGLVGDDELLGSEFPNGGARPIDGSVNSELNPEKFKELEFDESLVAEDTAKTISDDDSYITAELLNDVENELEQIDHAYEAPLDTPAEPHVIREEAETEQNDTLSGSEPDFKEALQTLDEPPLTLSIPSSAIAEEVETPNASQAKDDVVILDKANTKKGAEAKAQRLKAELSKISEAKKQLAAKKADKHTVKPTEDVERANAEVDDSTREASVPMLMEPVELGDTIDPNPPIQAELTLPDQPEAEAIAEPSSTLESFSAVDEDEPVVVGLDPLMDDLPDAVLTNSEQVGESLKDRPTPQEVLVINVLKGEDDPLKGADLNHIFDVCDLRYGEMNIFHRFEQANAKGKIQFSVANGVEPGTFDMATIDTMTTTGISFFMSLPGPEHPMDAFEAMVEVAHVFARNFNAELHDESHSDLTPQTIEHSRNRIREFCRKQKMSAAPA